MDQRIQDETIKWYQNDWRNIENSVFQVLNTHEGCFGGYDSMQSKLIIHFK